MRFVRLYSREKILAFIIRYKKQHDGNSPTLREIMDACDISSTSVASYALRNLVDEGRIRLSCDGAARRMEVVGGRWVYEATQL